ncbi:MAG: polysaccharide deacetylase family protein [Armatimonadetes bacterium]|nr:polysaccharide deacetylase family protein [Armatimonadota bacterium]
MTVLSCLSACLLLLACLSAPARAEEKPLAERLGYRADDRLLIIHADDAGMCHSVNEATTRALEKGIVTCASIMVPCPWFPEIARYAREHPEADFGVHLTLTSEWQFYRWRPVAPTGEASGLLDKEGFLPRGVEETVLKASPGEVEKEIRSQIERARSFGIRPTHIDSHMGTLFAGKFYPVYTRTAREMNVMPMLPAPTPEIRALSRQFGIDAEATAAALKKEGFVFIDTLVTGAGGDTLEERRENYYNILRNLKPGVTEIIVHLSMDDEEIRHIANHWQARWNEYRIFTDPKTKDMIDFLGVKLIGYKDLRKLFDRVSR